MVESTKNLLEEFGFTFEKRGLVTVKGKGQMMTYFLSGRDKPAKWKVNLFDVVWPHNMYTCNKQYHVVQRNFRCYKNPEMFASEFLVPLDEM